VPPNFEILATPLVVNGSFDVFPWILVPISVGRTCWWLWRGWWRHNAAVVSVDWRHLCEYTHVTLSLAVIASAPNCTTTTL